MGKPLWYTFEELRSVAVGSDGFHKPLGTMGVHGMFVSPHDDRVVVRGSAEGDVTVRPKDLLGYQHGRVWIVKPTRDPVRALLREKRISTSVLCDSNEPIRVSPTVTQLGSGYNCFFTGTRAVALGGGKSQDVPDSYRSCGAGDGREPRRTSWEVEHRDGEVIVVTSSRMTGPIDTATTICQIVIRNGVSRRRAAELLRGYFEGE